MMHGIRGGPFHRPQTLPVATKYPGKLEMTGTAEHSTSKGQRVLCGQPDLTCAAVSMVYFRHQGSTTKVLPDYECMQA